MKKNGILNSEISSVLSYLGHMDMITIADCGLPIPDNTKRIDISLEVGIPSFIKTLKAVAFDMYIQEIILAEEIKEQNIEAFRDIERELGKNIKTTFIPHDEFKKKTAESKAVIRTGETTPYANIILVSGCAF